MIEGRRGAVKRTPEKAPTVGEVGDRSELNDSIQDALELAALENASGGAFLLLAFGEMQKRGLSLDPYSLSTIMRVGFGTREELQDRIARMDQSDFDRKYPGGVGAAVKWYIQPPRKP